jgi:hypothetical protein
LGGGFQIVEDQTRQSHRVMEGGGGNGFPRLRRFNAKAQRFAEIRREFFFSAFLRVPLRLCVKTGLALVAAWLRCVLRPEPGVSPLANIVG